MEKTKNDLYHLVLNDVCSTLSVKKEKLKMNPDLKDTLLEFGKKNNFQFVNLSAESLQSKVQLEMLREQDLDMYNIFGFDDSSGVSRDDIASFYNELIDKLNP